MNISISDLSFCGYKHSFLNLLPCEYGIEIFYEFGSYKYWDKIISSYNNQKRSISIHAPSISVNLADPYDLHYLNSYYDLFHFVENHNINFIVIHTNESWNGNKSKIQSMVIDRLIDIHEISYKHKCNVLIENVGLKVNNTLLFDLDEYIELFNQFPYFDSLIDIGHANINQWDIAKVISILNSKIKAVHLHDNNGICDQHLPIGSGTINWEIYFDAIKHYSPNAVQVLEYAEISIQNILSHIDHIRAKYLI